MDTKENAQVEGREALSRWKKDIQRNSYIHDSDFRHTINFYLPKKAKRLEKELKAFADTIIHEVEPLVAENNRPENLPRIATYDSVGNRINQIIHHPTYVQAGNLIYASRLLERMARRGGLCEGLAFFFLSSQAGEAGHNCPIACSYGIVRVLRSLKEFPRKDFYLGKLIAPSFDQNYTGAQFVTEVQGGSDAGTNEVKAIKDKQGKWKVVGEKWFCSNANADLILITARHDPKISGTKGLGLFLVPAVLDTGEPNSYTFRRLKEKIGTRTLATAEIDFDHAYAIPVGKLQDGFKILMENVLHSSRLFNTFSVLGMARRAFQIAHAYAKHRKAFGHPIIEYPLVRESLIRIKAENTAMMASAFALAQLQDRYDLDNAEDEKAKLLLRLLANINKYLSALWTVEHVHHCLDVLAGNGTIETFSPIPLLLRDCIICENWEGTHNVLRMQILKDILRFHIDEIFIYFMQSVLQKASQMEPQKKRLQQKCEELGEKIKELKRSPPELQMLLIKECVDQMGYLFAAGHLLLEAIDQEGEGSSSKRNCLDHFINLYL